MMFKRLIIPITLSWILLYPEVRAQVFYNQTETFLKANSYWAFGHFAGLNFISGAPVADTSAMHSYLFNSGGSGYASVASPQTGQLYFYTDGSRVFDRTHSLTPNGTGLLGNTKTNAPQGVCIVPMVDSPGKYYLFSLSEYRTDNRGSFLYYSILDTSLNNGLGDVDTNRKNIPLRSSLSTSIVAVPGSNCNDIWVIVHDYPDPEFIAYHITPEGLDTTPVVSRAGTQLRGRMSGMGAYGTSNMAISPDRSMIAITSVATAPGGISRQAGALLCKFDPAAGTVSDCMLVSDSFNRHGVCFSPDNSRLYLTDEGLKTGGVYQYDISIWDSSAILSSETLVYTDLLTNPLYGLKLYKDKIYVATYWSSAISVINEPNLPGLLCDVRRNAIPLYPGTSSRYELPNDVVYPVQQDTIFEITELIYCAGDPPLELQVASGQETFTWDDGSTDSIRRISSGGTYWVRYNENSCFRRIDSFYVEEVDVNFDLGEDIISCTDHTPLILNVPVDGAAYRWQDQSTDSSYTVVRSGTYSVTATRAGCVRSDTVHIILTDVRQRLGDDIVVCTTDPVNIRLDGRVPELADVIWSTGETAAHIYVTDTGDYWITVSEGPCTGSDTIRVSNKICDCDLFVPSAFTPNNDGKNDVFRPLFLHGCPLSDYTLYIYNRWGELVFTSVDPLRGWDGTYKGQPVEVGVYMYHLNVETGTQRNKTKMKGDINLLR